MVGADHAELLRWYPPEWRERYGDELVAYLEDRYGDHLPAAARRSVAIGGLRERARRWGLSGRLAAPADRLRAGTLLVLVAWTMFFLGGLSLAKYSEHFDSALPTGTRSVPDASFALLRAAALVGVVAVGVGAILALPAFARWARAGGVRHVRGHFVGAGAFTVAAGALMAPVVLWAHHLGAHQRNGGSASYSALVVLWAVLIAVSAVLWTAAGVAAARRMTLSPEVLVAEATLALLVTCAMVVALVATVVWWGAMATHAPAFFGGGRPSTAGPPWDPWLEGTVALMAIGAVAAVAGAARITATLRPPHAA